jgi:hypothetical protein
MAQQLLVGLVYEISTVSEKGWIAYNEKFIYVFIKVGFIMDQCE